MVRKDWLLGKMDTLRLGEDYKMTLSIPYAKSLIKEIEQISPTLFKVGSHSVKIQTKKGRTLLICSCHNDTRFCVESPMCVGKLAVIIYLADNNFHKKIDKIISDYKKYKDCKLVPSVDCILNDLNNLKRVK
jgi:hypothetical protein